MLQALKFIILFTAITVLHWLFLLIGGRFGISINLMLSFAIASCLYLKRLSGYPTAFFCGLFLDLWGTRLFGSNAFSFTLVAMCIYEIFDRFDFDGFLSQWFTTFVMGILVFLTNYILFKLFVGLPIGISLFQFFANLIGTTLVAPFSFLLLSIFFYKKER